MFDVDVLLPDFWSILDAVPVTLAMALTVFLLSTLIGGLLAFIEHRRTPILRQLVVVYKITFKGIPMVVVIFLAYYGLPVALQFVCSLVGIRSTRILCLTGRLSLSRSPPAWRRSRLKW